MDRGAEVRDFKGLAVGVRGGLRVGGGGVISKEVWVVEKVREITHTTAHLPPSVPGELHRFHRGSTFQSAQKPNFDNGSSAKLAPIDFFRHHDDRLLQALVVQLV